MRDEMARITAVRPDVTVGDPPPLDWESLLEFASDSRGEREPRGGLRMTGSARAGRTSPRRRRALIWASSAAAVIVAVGIGAIGREVTARQAATPPQSISPTNPPQSMSPTATVPASPTSLAGLANIAEQQPDVGTGTVRYLKLDFWTRTGYMSNSQDGTLTHGTSEMWVAPDGSGKVLSEPPDAIFNITAGDYPAGSGLGDWPECRAGTVTREQPNDPSQAAELGIQPPAADWIGVLSSCNWWAGPLPGKAQAKLLRELAATSGVEERGLKTDRLGRTGLAFAVPRKVDSGTDEIEVILDPATGRLLASQYTLTSADVTYPLPSVSQYVAFDEAAMVPSVGARP